MFLLGCSNLILVPDHRPLVKLFGDKKLRDILNPRLLAMKKTLIYSFNMKYLLGKITQQIFYQDIQHFAQALMLKMKTW